MLAYKAFFWVARDNCQRPNASVTASASKVTAVISQNFQRAFTR